MAYSLSVRSVERIRKAFCEQGMGIFEKKTRKPRSDKKIDGRIEAHLLADKLVEMKVIGSISATAVGTTLKKRIAAFPGKNVGDPARTQRRFCVQDGASTGRP